ncbi:MAG: magnesium transporter [Epulopiscium sp.]|nr:magnesium transporter [Candidatus Epulonipiscium sp.]
MRDSLQNSTEQKKIKKLEYQFEDKEKGTTIFLGAFDLQKWEEAAQVHGIMPILFEEALNSKSARYESLDGYDTIHVNLIDYHNLKAGQRKVFIYLNREKILFFCDEPERIFKILEGCIASVGDKISLERIISDFFNHITKGATPMFDKIEKEILDLEQELITSQKKDCVYEIVSLRKRLMILKRYFEQFLNVLEGVGQNENELYDPKMLRYFRTLEKRIDRFYQNVLNLRDYVTQVRESYQAEVDISLNVTMKIFTVITTIFLPLTLIVGWYGMNLPMPEYEWKHSYAMVIVLSLLVVLAGIVFFKKKKWF